MKFTTIPPHELWRYKGIHLYCDVLLFEINDEIISTLYFGFSPKPLAFDL